MIKADSYCINKHGDYDMMQTHVRVDAKPTDLRMELYHILKVCYKSQPSIVIDAVQQFIEEEYND